MLFSKPLRTMVGVLTCLSFSGVTTALSADPLPAPWQERREEMIQIVTEACNGDVGFAAIFNMEVNTYNPVALNSLAWAYSSCDNFKFVGLTKSERALRTSAEGGYPIGMFNYGKRLAYGRENQHLFTKVEMSQDLPAGLDWMERAARGGYGIAAQELAHIYSSGDLMAPNFKTAEQWLELASREGLSGKRFDKISQKIRAGRSARNYDKELADLMTDQLKAVEQRHQKAVDSLKSLPTLAQLSDAVPNSMFYSSTDDPINLMQCQGVSDDGQEFWTISREDRTAQRFVFNADNSFAILDIFKCKGRIPHNRFVCEHQVRKTPEDSGYMGVGQLKFTDERSRDGTRKQAKVNFFSKKSFTNVDLNCRWY